MDAQFEQDLSRLRKARIFFAHQSVGHNILTGLQGLLGANPPAWSIVKILPDETPPSGPCLAHATLGENANPASKMEAFSGFLGRHPATHWDVVLMKLCYLDVTRDTDVPALFNIYKDAATAVRGGDPQRTLVHVAVPLTRESGFKTLLKKILGKSTARDHNVKRQEYNELLLREFHGEPIFDIARIESTHADGSRESFRKKGRTCFNLAGEYTEDGGHLNEAGSRVLAREFVRVLAGALGRND